MKNGMRLTEFASGGGCGCKLSPPLLHDLLQQANIFSPPPAQLLVGAAGADDAAVWQLNDAQALVASADFFSPLVDDGYEFGRIAAANALSDIYAMGAKPLLALALAAMPAQLPQEVMAAVMAGGQAMCAQAGAVVAGGHSINAKEPLYGLAVLGLVHPQHLLTNAGGCAGDVLLLGKPLGVGVLAAAARQGDLPAEEMAVLLRQTTQLNSAGAALPQVAGVHALTDVTGFGLLGHLAEVCRAAQVGARVEVARLPLLAAAQRYAQQGVASGACARNWQSVAAMVREEGVEIAAWQRTLLTDPQTSGGLLVCCTAEAVAAVCEVFAAHGQEAVRVGELTRGQGIVLC